MKTKSSTRNVFGLGLALAFLIPAVTKAASTATFDNQSGKPALVKLVGPTASSVTVENSKKESVSVTAGHYFIKVRYGTPGAYSYSKGDEFDVTETATAFSDITITLHKVVAGNYGSKAISEGDFEADRSKAATAESGTWQTSWKSFVEEIQPYFLKAGGQDELRKLMDEKQVTWEGTVRSITLTGAGTGYIVSMPPYPLRLSSGKRVTLDVLTLIPKGTDTELWKPVMAGDKVRFTTKLEDRSSTARLFEIAEFGEGLTELPIKVGVDKGSILIFVNTEGATLRSVTKSPERKASMAN
jgi:hypothetical protein